jgi:uncharacterized protein (DUF427 family)
LCQSGPDVGEEQIMSSHVDHPRGELGATGPDTDSRLRVERSPKRIRALVAGVVVVDTRAARLVWEHPYYPTYYVPREDVRADLVPAGRHAPRGGLGEADAYDVRVAGRTLPGAALAYPDSPALRDLVRLSWKAMDEWLEEDEPVYVHPRDPYKRVDILASSRHVRIVVDGVTVADSTQPRILFETGLPPRYYLPISDVRADLLRPSQSVSHCPYKGTASWWTLEAGGARLEDVAWIYRAPTPESQKIAGLVAFYDERVDVYVDEQLQDRPDTPFT